jgi:hypothetical protein
MSCDAVTTEVRNVAATVRMIFLWDTPCTGNRCACAMFSRTQNAAVGHNNGVSQQESSFAADWPTFGSSVASRTESRNSMPVVNFTPGWLELGDTSTCGDHL